MATFFRRWSEFLMPESWYKFFGNSEYIFKTEETEVRDVNQLHLKLLSEQLKRIRSSDSPRQRVLIMVAVNPDVNPDRCEHSNTLQGLSFTLKNTDEAPFARQATSRI